MDNNDTMSIQVNGLPCDFCGGATRHTPNCGRNRQDNKAMRCDMCGGVDGEHTLATPSSNWTCPNARFPNTSTSEHWSINMAPIFEEIREAARTKLGYDIRNAGPGGAIEVLMEVIPAIVAKRIPSAAMPFVLAGELTERMLREMEIIREDNS